MQVPDTVKVLVLPYKPPRKSERTWPSIRGSVASMGSKAIVLASRGINKRAHG